MRSSNLISFMCYNLLGDFMILDIIHGHIEEIVCGKNGLALSHEIRDMEEYVTNLSGKQNLRCDGCIDEGTRK